MNANELRVGNWYSQFGNLHQVTWDTIKALGDAPETQLWCKPIPLSPEILEKCEGFIKQVGTPNNSKAIYFDFVGYRIYCTDAFCSIHFDAGDWFPEIRKINNLHTFQNWYYFNTGHELTYKQ